MYILKKVRRVQLAPILLVFKHDKLLTTEVAISKLASPIFRIADYEYQTQIEKPIKLAG